MSRDYWTWVPGTLHNVLKATKLKAEFGYGINQLFNQSDLNKRNGPKRTIRNIKR